MRLRRTDGHRKKREISTRMMHCTGFNARHTVISRMQKSNFERMIAMADEVFDTRHDPDQLSVTQEDVARLKELHPATMSEYADEHGPAVWILLVPTTHSLMMQFVHKEITEKALVHETPLHAAYDAIYLCSAMALPEYRGRGIAKKLALDAIAAIRKDHDITALFVWPFTAEGDGMAGRLATATGLPLLKRAD